MADGGGDVVLGRSAGMTVACVDKTAFVDTRSVLLREGTTMRGDGFARETAVLI
jgi:hypothetical protein